MVIAVISKELTTKQKFIKWSIYEKSKLYYFLLLNVTITNDVVAQNPIIRNQFTADPSARVFDGKVYLYPSHDIPPENGRCRDNWFCMEDYHVFSSENLTEWTDHGIIVSQNKVPWVDSTSYSMWAPDCIEKDGKYYFYFPARTKDTSFGRGFAIGVAIADIQKVNLYHNPNAIEMSMVLILMCF